MKCYIILHYIVSRSIRRSNSNRIAKENIESDSIHVQQKRTNSTVIEDELGSGRRVDKNLRYYTRNKECWEKSEILSSSKTLEFVRKRR